MTDIRSRTPISAGARLCASMLTIFAGFAQAAPAEQQAIVQTGNGGPEVLQMQTVPVLAPGPGQVLIRVYAAGVNPIDYKMREGMGPPPGGRPGGPPDGPPGGPAGAPPGSGPGAPPGAPPGGAPQSRIPGFDAAGVIESTGEGVEGFSPGDAVFSMIGRVQVDGLNGSYSHFVIAPADNVVHKPADVTFAEAAGLGTVGMTAARTLFPANIQPGQRVFIDGIAGGVGSTAAQIAKALGAVVIGTASPRHDEFLESIGVDEVVDYTTVKFEDVVEPVDVVLETVSAENAARAVKIVKKGGYLASIAGPPPAAACEAAGIRCPGGGPPQAGSPSEGDYLEKVASLAEAGKLKVNIDASYPLAEAGQAQAELAKRHTEGKIVLVVVPEKANSK